MKKKLLEKELHKIIRKQIGKEKIRFIKKLKSLKPKYSKLKYKLNVKIENYLKKKKIRLYTHQADAINDLLSGKDIIITTPTDSGKSLVFQFSIFNELLNNPQSTAMLIYPNNALADNQKKKLDKLNKELGNPVKIHVRNHEASSEQKEYFYEQQNGIVITTKESLLYFILGGRYDKFLSRLKFVVIDEAHEESGIGGSHFSNVIRNLRRVCKDNFQFILCSATMSNPEEYAFKLTGTRAEVISKGTNPRGNRAFLLLNGYDGKKDSSFEISSKISRCLYKKGIKALNFVKTRKEVEALGKVYYKKFKSFEGLDLVRGGHTKEEKKEVYRKLNNPRDKSTVVATSLLELGIDCDIEVCIITGFPGLKNSFFQRAGRPGRKGKDAVIIFIGGKNPMDQWYLNNPKDLFDGKMDGCFINPDNTRILKPHLHYAAHILPIRSVEMEYFGSNVQKCLNGLVQENKLKLENEKFVAVESPPDISMRAMGHEIPILASYYGKLKTIGHTDEWRGHREFCAGTTYSHKFEDYEILPYKRRYYGRSAYLVKKLNSEKNTFLKMDNEVISVEEPICAKNFNEISITLRKVKVRETQSTLLINEKGKTRCVPVEPKSKDLNTETICIRFPKKVWSKLNLDECRSSGGLHGAEHAMISLFPVICSIDRRDIGGISTLDYEGSPHIFIYEGYEGGIGFCEIAFRKLEEHLGRSLDLIKNCKCREKNGCPACIHSYKCGNENETLDKKATIKILEYLQKSVKSIKGKNTD